MNETAEKLAAFGFTPRVVIFSLVFCIVWNLIFYVGIKQLLNLFVVPPLILLMIIEALIIKLLGKRFQFTLQEWTVFSTIAISGLLTGTLYGSVWGESGAEMGLFTWLHTFQLTYYSLAYAYTMEGVKFPELWLPRDPAVLEPFRLGGAINWSAWIPTLLFWISSYITLYLANYFFMLLFRKPWIDEERLPYPALVTTYELLTSVKSEEDGTTNLSFFNLAKNKIFWIPFIIGCIVIIPELLSRDVGIDLFPRGEAADPGTISINLAPYLGGFIPGMDGDPWGPWGFFWSWLHSCAPVAPIWFFLPMNTLKSVIVWLIVYHYIIPIGLISAGFFEDYWGAISEQSPFAPMFGAAPWPAPYNGWAFGIALWILFRYRKYIVGSLKKAISGEPREPSEPHSWRTVWLGFIGCSLLWWGIMIASGVDAIIIVSLLIWLFLCLTMSRTWAEVGRCITGGCMDLGPGVLIHRDAFALLGYNVYPGNITVNADALYFGVSKYGCSYRSGAHNAALGIFKLASMTKTDPRSVGWAYIIALIVGISFQIPLTIWMSYTYGWSTLFSRELELGGMCEWATWAVKEVPQMSTVEYTMNPNYHLYVLTGTVVVFILSWLHARFAWFWFNPIAMGIAHLCMRNALLMIVAFFILKWLIFRLGGARAYGKYGVPAVLGFWLGLLFMMGITKLAIWITGAAEYLYA